MKYFAELKSVKGSLITADVEKLDLMVMQSILKKNDSRTIEITIADKRKITPDQRKKIYALIADISDYTGYWLKVEAPAQMKFKYYIDTGSEEFSLSNCSISKANDYLNWLLDFCFEQDIPFKTKTWDLLPVDYAMQLRCLRHRRCCICGKKADIAHYETVGMGRNRKSIDHSKYHFMALCRDHHTEQHTEGLINFCQKYHIKPVKLSNEDRKKLHVGG